MSTVGTTTFLEDGDQNYITLNPPGEQYLRRIVYRNNWSMAMVGMLYSIQSNVTAVGGMWIGMGSSANGAGIGLKNGAGAIKRMVGGGTSQWGSIMGYGSSYNSIAYSNVDISGSIFTHQAVFAASISASSFQNTNGNALGDIVFPTTESPARKGIQIISLNKSGFNIVSSIYVMTSGIYTGSNGSNHNFTNNTLFSAMGDVIPYVDTNQMVGSGGFYTTLAGSATDEINYPLDTINIAWTGSVPVRIYQIAMRVIK